jgi:spore maturation protein CgeB
MSYRFVRVTSNYPQFIQSFYLKNPDIHMRSYSDQYLEITRDSYETATSYTKNLKEIGVSAFDIISNAEILQNTWKKENNLPPETTSQELILKQLEYYRPEVVWIDDFTIIDKAWKAELLKKVPSIKLLIGQICAPYNSITEEKFKLFDIMLTCIPCFKKDLTKLGVKTHLVYYGFETSALENINVGNYFPETDFLFSGSLYAGSGFHKSRIEYIETMLRSGIDIDLYCNLESWKTVMAKKGMYFTLNALKKLHLENVINNVQFLKKNKSYGDVPVHYYSKKLLESSKPPVFGYEMYQLLYRSKICFNIHGEVAEKCAGNIRLFEATGLGTCLVTDWKENITDLFVPDKEIVTYRSVDECIEKVKWLIANPAEREKIAKAGQKRTLTDHTMAKRAKLVDEIIKEELNKINS